MMKATMLRAYFSKGLLLCAFAAAPLLARAGGVSNYLPLNLEPEMERQIERVLILADEPILKRPFAVELVEDRAAAGLRNRQAAVRKGASAISSATRATMR